MSQTLTETQSAALFDILSHYDTYAEIRDFRLPGRLKYYGPPFNHNKGEPSTSPALQTLVSRFLLTLPGLKDLPDDFWKVQCHEIIESFEVAELSESYDKGSIGSRKTLATAISALIEYPVRGTAGGFAEDPETKSEYDIHNADDLSRAFHDFLNRAVYGDILKEMVEKTSETDQLSDHPPLTQAVHEFVLVNLASFMHYILILSPKGQYLLKLIENIHKLIPYVLVRQTLKIGNVASMINAMVKFGLAKMSVASLTNWIGLTNSGDEGMNLLQQIISTTLSFDIKELESRALKIEKDKDGPSKEQLAAIKSYQDKDREKHESIRKQSEKESVSIVISILKAASESTSLTDNAHRQALDYLSVQLSIRDRKEILKILCHSVPDHLTTSIRSLVSAYEPVIRQMHKAIDLSDTFYDFEMFTKDLIKLAKVQSPGSGKDSTKTQVPTVGDFIQLLKKHQYSCHKFVHQCCKNGKEVTSWYLEWAQKAASYFRRRTASDTSESIPRTGAGDLNPALAKLFAELDTETQKSVLPILDRQNEYLESMHTASKQRLETVLNSAPSDNPAITKILSRSNSRGSRSLSRPSSRPSSRHSSRQSSRASSRNNSPAPSNGAANNSTAPPPSKLADAINPEDIKPAKLTDPTTAPPVIDSDPGPGAYLSRWQDLLDNTPVTPLTPKGKVQQATSKKVVEKSAADVDGTKLVEFQDGKSGAEKVKEQVDHEAGNGYSGKGPDVRPVVAALAPKFRQLLAQRSLDW